MPRTNTVNLIALLKLKNKSERDEQIDKDTRTFINFVFTEMGGFLKVIFEIVDAVNNMIHILVIYCLPQFLLANLQW